MNSEHAQESQAEPVEGKGKWFDSMNQEMNTHFRYLLNLT